MSNSQIDPTLEVAAHGLAEDGRGIAKHGEWTVFVADLLPGERARVEIEHRSHHRPEAWAHIVERVGALSPERQAPACPAFGRCGGCRWQHLRGDAQRALKRERIASSLADVFGDDAPEVEPPLAAPSELGYRNKGKYVVGFDGAELTLGAFEPRSHRIVSTLGCRLVAPPIDELARGALAAIDTCGIDAYDESSGKGELRYLVVRANQAGHVHVLLVAHSRVRRDVVESLADALSALGAQGVSLMLNDTSGGAILSGPSQVLAGSPTLEEATAGTTLRLDATSFWQVNSEQAEVLYQRVTEMARVAPGMRALDLYCGVGGIAMHLARAGVDVVAVERHAPAIGIARAAASLGGLHIDFRQDDAGDADVTGFDLICVNPPRKGLSPATCERVAGSGARRLVYVSCGPASLARDLKVLVDAGYRIESVLPVDLMPGTSQIETVVSLVLGDSGPTFAIGDATASAEP